MKEKEIQVREVKYVAFIFIMVIVLINLVYLLLANKLSVVTNAMSIVFTISFTFKAWYSTKFKDYTIKNDSNYMALISCAKTTQLHDNHYAVKSVFTFTRMEFTVKEYDDHVDIRGPKILTAIFETYNILLSLGPDS